MSSFQSRLILHHQNQSQSHTFHSSKNTCQNENIFIYGDPTNANWLISPYMSSGPGSFLSFHTLCWREKKEEERESEVVPFCGWVRSLLGGKALYFLLVFFLRCGSFFGFVDFISLIVFYDFNGRIFWNVDFAFWLSDWLHVVLDLWFVVLSEYYIFWVHVFFLF